MIVSERDYKRCEKTRGRIIKLMSILYHEEKLDSLKKYIEKCICESKKYRVYALILGNRICGVAIVKVVTKRVISLMEIVVYPKGRGYGSLFLNMLRRRFLVEGIAKIVVPVVASSGNTRRFYLKNSFKMAAQGGMELEVE